MLLYLMIRFRSVFVASVCKARVQIDEPLSWNAKVVVGSIFASGCCYQGGAKIKRIGVTIYIVIISITQSTTTLHTQAL